MGVGGQRVKTAVLLCLVVAASATARPTPGAARGPVVGPVVGPVLSTYAHRQQITVVGGRSAVYGSTRIPVAEHAIDYVVMLHLHGAEAAAVYDTAAYNARRVLRGVPFADVTLWYTGGGGPRQIDVDYDPYTFGPWSRDNVTLWFKLQAPLDARPATDSHYVLAWGNARPVVRRNWAAIYPLQDNFDGPALNAKRWITYAAGAVSVRSGIATIASWSEWAGIYSRATYGDGYAVSARITMPPLPAQQQINVGWATHLTGAPYYLAADVNTISASRWQARMEVGTDTFFPITSLDHAMHVYTVARDLSGVHYYWRDADRGCVSNQQASSSALDVAAFTYRGAIARLDWVKVRPWIPDGPRAVER